MVIAITDACIFIDILDIRITSLFFELELEVHTTYDVWNELYEEQQETLSAFKSVGKLNVHILEPEDIEKIIDSSYPKSLSSPDKSVLYLADKFGAMLLSSDKAVRNFAKSKAIDHHGTFWVLDQLVEKQLISQKSASARLKGLFNKYLMYRNNIQLRKEADKRFDLWD